MKNQKELKELYMNIICNDVWESEDMRKFAKNNCCYVVELSNGNIIDYDKPRIQKNFCFGMGAYATYTQEDFERAEGLADNAKKNIEYFISENMSGIKEQIKQLKEALEGVREAYTFTQYTGQPDESRLKAYNVVRICDNPEWTPGRWSSLRDVQKLGADDIQTIIDGWQEVKKAFAKRLDTYLKKYGLSKLNVWTYVRD